MMEGEVQNQFESPHGRVGNWLRSSRNYPMPMIQHTVTDLLACEELRVFQLRLDEGILEKIRV